MNDKRTRLQPKHQRLALVVVAIVVTLGLLALVFLLVLVLSLVLGSGHGRRHQGEGKKEDRKLRAAQGASFGAARPDSARSILAGARWQQARFRNMYQCKAGTRALSGRIAF